MISFFKAFPRHVKSAFVSIVRHLAMSLSASSAVTITLILFSAFLMVAGNVSLFADNIESDLRIHVQLEPEVEDKEELAKIEKQLKEISGVKNVEYSNPDQELELMIKEQGEEYEMFRGSQNPLAPAYFVSVRDADKIEKISDQISKMDSVMNAVYGGSSVSKLISVLNSVRFGGFIFVILLTFLAIFLISNSIKMTIYARHSEIAIMRNVGATNGYIKVPFMIEGMLIGLIGSIIPCLLTYFGYQYLYGVLSGQLMSGIFALKPVMPFALEICGILALAGILVGLFGSFISTTKYLHWKR